MELFNQYFIKSDITDMTNDSDTIMRSTENEHLLNSPYSKIIHDSPIDITGSDINSLEPQKWLNNWIIDFINDFNMKDNTNPIKLFSTNISLTMQKRDSADIMRLSKTKWKNNINLLHEAQHILIPYNFSNAHWSLILLCRELDSWKVLYIDSIAKNKIPEDFITKIVEYLWYEEKFAKDDIEILKFLLSGKKTADIPTAKNEELKEFVKSISKQTIEVYIHIY